MIQTQMQKEVTTGLEVKNLNIATWAERDGFPISQDEDLKACKAVQQEYEKGNVWKAKTGTQLVTTNFKIHGNQLS